MQERQPRGSAHEKKRLLRKRMRPQASILKNIQ